jgi:hypothetical protein
MASAKKRRKQARQAYKQQHPTVGPFRHPDGDRRHRDSGLTARQAVAWKRAMQQTWGMPMPDKEDESGRRD